MSNVVFNTHSFVKRLTEVGMPTEQAEVLAESYATLIDEKLATKRDLKELTLATKRDLRELALATKRGLEELALATKRDLKELALATKRDLKELELRLRHDLTLRLGSMMVAAVGVVAVPTRVL